MGIKAIEQAIASIFSTVTSIKAVYFHPVTEIGRQLPALIVRYNGFEQRPAAMSGGFSVIYSFTLDLFVPAEAKTLESAWDKIKELVPVIIGAFRSDYTLKGTCVDSNLESGEPVISQGETTYVGHTFTLRAEVYEEVS